MLSPHLRPDSINDVLWGCDRALSVGIITHQDLHSVLMWLSWDKRPSRQRRKRLAAAGIPRFVPTISWRERSIQVLNEGVVLAAEELRRRKVEQERAKQRAGFVRGARVKCGLEFWAGEK